MNNNTQADESVFRDDGSAPQGYQPRMGEAPPSASMTDLYKTYASRAAAREERFPHGSPGENSIDENEEAGIDARRLFQSPYGIDNSTINVFQQTNSGHKALRVITASTTNLNRQNMRATGAILSVVALEASDPKIYLALK